MLKSFFNSAIRNLRRNKVYSFINIAGLSLGLACAMLILLYIKDEVSYDRFHTNLDHIYRIASQQLNADGSKGYKDSNTGYLQGPKLSANIPEMKSFVRVRGNSVDIKTGTEVKSKELLNVDSNFFSVFTFPLLSGNPQTCLLDPHSIVISEDMAKTQFGTSDALGKFIMIKDNDRFIPYTVSAVSKKCPQNSSVKFDALLPLIVSPEEASDRMQWFNSFLNTFVVLNPEANSRSVETKMDKSYAAQAKDAIREVTEKFGPQSKFNYILQPFKEMHLSKDLPSQNGLSDASNPMYSYILSGIAMFILLIACINFVNLTVARSVRRAKEIGVRKVIGGSRRQLIFQFLGESFILCFIAFSFALLLVKLILPVFNDLSNKSLAISYLFDVKLVAGYLVLFLLTSLMAGFYPALVLSNYDPVKTLYGRFQIAGKNYLQKSLVVLQFTLATFLIVATAIIFTQFNYLTTEKLGYDDSHLVVVNKNNLNRSEAATFKNELLKSPAVADVAPRNGCCWFTVAKVNSDSTVSFSYETVDENFLPLLKIPVLEGRNFSSAFPSDSANSVIVNESFVKKAGWKQPIGQMVNFWYDNNKTYRVIGVTKDYHFAALTQKIQPQLFTMKASNDYGTMLIKLRPNRETDGLKHIEKTFKSLFPINPYTYDFKDLENKKNYEAEEKWKQIMLFGAILTIFISCIGLFGLSVLSAEKRTKEIGIRKVLGASVTHVVTILSRDFLKLVTISLVLALPLAWLATYKWLENYPYKVTPGWTIFSGGALLVVFIALATVSFQAVRSALANPVRSLRSE